MVGVGNRLVSRRQSKTNPLVAFTLAACMVVLLMVLVFTILAIALPKMKSPTGTEEQLSWEELSVEEQRIQRYSLKPTIKTTKETQQRFPNFCFFSSVRQQHSCIPRTLVIGGQQADARGLFQGLKQHPRISGAQVRDVDFYSDTENWLRGMEFYGWKYHYPEEQLIGLEAKQLVDVSPSYLGAPYVAERVYSALRESARFIVILRDPVKRALAHIRHQHRVDLHQHDTYFYPTYIERFNTTDADFLAEDLLCLQKCAPPFATGSLAQDGLDERADLIGQRSKTSRIGMQPPPGGQVPSSGFGMLDRCQDCSAYPLKTPHMIVPGGFLAKGLYAELLEPYFNFFGMENFLFIKYEDIIVSPQRTVDYLNDIGDFLGVDRLAVDEWMGENDTDFKDHETVVDEDIGEVDPALLEWLQEFYKVPNQELEDLIGHRFRW